MPYDFENNGESELRLLGLALRSALLDRLHSAAMGYPLISESIEQFAAKCFEERASVITFNYDDLLDRALFLATRKIHGYRGWDPDIGYGFLCRGATQLLGGGVYASEMQSTIVLKLHGSVNWRARLGAAKPYSIDSICHTEDWDEEEDEFVDVHLEREPFIVPPVMQKASLVNEPLLRFLWSRAFRLLGQADRIIFLGYSFPPTDLAARFLFKEAVPKSAQVVVVNSDRRQALKRGYREIFPQLSDKSFKIGDARKWCLQYALPIE
jgi:hypothetical protein